MLHRWQLYRALFISSLNHLPIELNSFIWFAIFIFYVILLIFSACSWLILLSCLSLLPNFWILTFQRFLGWPQLFSTFSRSIDYRYLIFECTYSEEICFWSFASMNNSEDASHPLLRNVSSKFHWSPEAALMIIDVRNNYPRLNAFTSGNIRRRCANLNWIWPLVSHWQKNDISSLQSVWNGMQIHSPNNNTNNNGHDDIILF